MEVGTYEVVLNLIYFIALTSLFRNSLNRSKIFILTILKTFVPYQWRHLWGVRDIHGYPRDFNVSQTGDTLSSIR